MATGMEPAEAGGRVVEPTRREGWLVLAAALAFVILTRAPVARSGPVDTDEVGYLQTIAVFRFPAHHTLFLASARVLGAVLGDPYRGFLALDMLVSAGALWACWWWLRALVRPSTALAATLALGVGPVFWAYGAMAGNYTMIPLVGSTLLGLAVRTWRDPKPWHPFAAAVVLALGTGYRQDIGTFWLPVLLVVLWPHRWVVALQALAVFTVLNLAWLAAMLHDVGGLEQYRALTRDFVQEAGYKNSVWNLGLADATGRYALKGAMALAWTLGPGLLFAPRGLARLAGSPRGGWRAALLGLSVAPALAMHGLVHFGVPGYAFHYVPALMPLVALGIGRLPAAGRPDRAPARLAALAGVLAAAFLLYPTDYDRPGLRGDFDLAFARHTRAGLRTPSPAREPSTWRTSNSPTVRRRSAPGSAYLAN